MPVIAAALRRRRCPRRPARPASGPAARPSSSASARLAAALPHGSVSHVQALGSQPMVAMTVDAAGLAALRAQPDVVRVSRNKLQQDQHDLPATSPASVRPPRGPRATPGAGQTIAIVDTGVDKTNAFLSGKVVAEGCFTSVRSTAAAADHADLPGWRSDHVDRHRQRRAVPASCAAGCFHGTHVAGIAAGGAAAPSPGWRRGPRSSPSTSSPSSPTRLVLGGLAPCIGAWDSDMIRGLDYVYSLRNCFHIASVNMSLGGDVSHRHRRPLRQRAPEAGHRPAAGRRHRHGHRLRQRRAGRSR